VLFTRSQSGLLPTQAAQELRPHAEDMAAAAAAFARTGSADFEQAAGVIRLAAADVVGVEVLPAILSEFRAKISGNGDRAVIVQPNGGSVAPRCRHCRAHGAAPAKGIVGKTGR